MTRSMGEKSHSCFNVTIRIFKRQIFQIPAYPEQIPSHRCDNEVIKIIRFTSFSQKQMSVT